MTLRRDERRIVDLVKRIDASEFTIWVKYDTKKRYLSRFEPDWHVGIEWSRDRETTATREASGYGRTLTAALDALDIHVNSRLFLDGTTEPEAKP